MVQSRQRSEHHPAEAHELRLEPAGGWDEGAPRLVGIDHLQLAMPAGHEAEQASEEFYGRALGLRRVTSSRSGSADPTQDQGGCWFEGACVRLHLGVKEPFTPAHRAKATLLVDDIDAMASQVAATGGVLRISAAAEQQPAIYHVYTYDPFGNRIELIEASNPTPEMFELMADHTIYPHVLIDPGGTVRWVGTSVERFFGYAPSELVGKRFDHIIAPGSIDAAFEAFADIADAYDPAPWGGVGVPIDLLRSDGTLVACEVAAITTRRTGLPWYVVAIRLAGYERALDYAIEAMASGTNLGEMLARIVRAIEHMVPETGVAVGDHWTGDRFEASAGNATNLLDNQPGAPWATALATGEDQWVDDLDQLPRPLAVLARAEGYAACWVHPVTPALGDQPTAAIVLWRRFAGKPTRFMWNTVRRAGKLLSLTLQWDRSHSSLEFAATHDPMTGLVNRQAFRDRLEKVTGHRVDSAGEGAADGADEAQSSGSAGAAVLYIDLDRFKPVNDELGHLTGDRVLTLVAERVMNAVRPGDMVGRMGGDEFAVICERLAQPEDAVRVASRLLEVLRRPITLPEHTDIDLGASIGVVDVGDGRSVDDVLAQADEAMRSAKRDGGNCWRWYNPEGEG